MTPGPAGGGGELGPPLSVDIGNLVIPPDSDAADSEAAGGGDTEPLYPTMAAWFQGWFHRVIERQPSSGLIWCPHWWRHNEAVAVLDALWMAWEGARIAPDADAMLHWWERATGMLHHLTSPDHGPFAGCTSRKHQVGDGDLALPYEPEPPGWFGLVLDTGEPPP